MSKNNNEKVQKTNLEAQVEATEEKKVAKVEKKDNKKQDKNPKKKAPKEKGKLKKKAKETISEIKKVTWPTFGEVCERTGVVLVVVLVFAALVFGLDMGLGSLMGLLRG